MANPADLRAKHAAATKEVQHYLARQEFEMAVLAITPLLADLWEAVKSWEALSNCVTVDASLERSDALVAYFETREKVRQALKALEEHGE